MSLQARALLPLALKLCFLLCCVLVPVYCVLVQDIDRYIVIGARRG
jgi:hypothetical protein